jgi:GntR family phosphonate transport system transcriptional regulator
MTQAVDSLPRPDSLESQAGLALWRRVADALERAIAAGTYSAGSRLPGELEIAQRFGVNRHTVRRALAALAERGLVRAERGSGTYVEARRIPYPIRSRTRFSEIIGTTGREAGGRMVAASEESASAEIARRLALPTGASLVRIEAQRQADGVPLCIATSWLPAERFPDAGRVYAGRRSMTATLVQFGVRDYVRKSTQVTASLADPADAMWLGLGPGAPVLVVDSTDADVAGRPILTTRARFAAERIAFVIET